jgi:hypothetical protein
MFIGLITMAFLLAGFWGIRQRKNEQIRFASNRVCLGVSSSSRQNPDLREQQVQREGRDSLESVVTVGGLPTHLGSAVGWSMHLASTPPKGEGSRDTPTPKGTITILIDLLVHPHNSNPSPANAAALLKHEEAATSAAGALDADPNGSDATAE